MSLLNALMGNANTLDAAAATAELTHILIPGERVEHAYKLVRDLIVFTDKRLLLVDKQGVTGRKTEYHSVPYARISHFSVETAGTLDMDIELITPIAIEEGLRFAIREGGRTVGSGVVIGVNE